MFWEIAGVILQVVQMGLYLTGVDKYKDKLIDLAQWLCDSGDRNAAQYQAYRNCDASFYTYYQSLPGYGECGSNIRRSKGAAFYGYGSRLRRSLHSGRGFTPLTKVHINSLVSSDAVAQSSLNRAVTQIRERDRRNSHELTRWAAIAGAPVNVEAYQPAPTGAIISQSFKTLKGFGRGFNSAGAAFGNSLYRLLD